MKKLYLLAGVFALLTGGLFYAYLTQLGQQAPVEYDRVVVAAQDIAALQTLTPDLLKVVEVQKGSAHPASVSDPALLEGKITEQAILKDEPVFAQRLKEPGNLASGLAYTVPAGYRALSLQVDQVSGLGGYLRAGDRVDVVLTVGIPETQPDGSEKEIATTLLLLEDLEVLVCGTAQSAADGALLYESVTLAVTPEQALRAAEGATQGALRLLLRNPQDEGRASPAPVRRETLLD